MGIFLRSAEPIDLNGFSIRAGVPVFQGLSREKLELSSDAVVQDSTVSKIVSTAKLYLHAGTVKEITGEDVYITEACQVGSITAKNLWYEVLLQEGVVELPPFEAEELHLLTKGDCESCIIYAKGCKHNELNIGGSYGIVSIMEEDHGLGLQISSTPNSEFSEKLSALRIP